MMINSKKSTLIYERRWKNLMLHFLTSVTLSPCELMNWLKVDFSLACGTKFEVSDRILQPKRTADLSTRSLKDRTQTLMFLVSSLYRIKETCTLQEEPTW